MTGAAKSLVTAAVEPAAGTTDETVEQWYKGDVSDIKIVKSRVANTLGTAP
jgi:hypothetical protein